ncbi:DNA mismatch repair protein MutS [Infundibulicybe gibba]|nr:DNA mismatch repair protein MutS [Infundibulicybe gibba]
MPPSKRKRVKRSPQGTPSESDGSHRSTATRHKRVRWEGSKTPAEPDGEVTDEEVEVRALDKICFTVWCSHSRMGCAYYDPVSYIIYVLEDTQESAHFDLTKLILEQLNPDVVLTTSRADEGSIDILRDHMDTSSGVFQIRPHKEFSPSKGRERLLALNLFSELSQPDFDSHTSLDSNPSNHHKNAYDFMQRRREITGDPSVRRWNASIRLANFSSTESSPLCVASIGALLDHLVRERAASDLGDDGVSGLEVRGIEILGLNEAMQINADALSSLQIFEDESHASVHSDKTKEGLSLFGILNNTKTSLGRSLLRTWLLRPSLSLSVIDGRHNAVACFLRPENHVPANAMHHHLTGLKNVPRILGAMRTGRAKLPDWQGLVKFAFHSAMLRDALTELYQAENVEIVKQLLLVLDTPRFREVGSKINETIDWEESAIAGRVCVRPHVDDELDSKKRVYHGIDSVLSKVAEQICRTVPAEYAPSLNVVYFPQLGFLICIPMPEAWREGGVEVINSWNFQFSSDAHVYFKSQEMKDMDIHIGDLHSSIVDREIEIIQDLLLEILLSDEVMGATCDACAELDCLLSFAEVSRLNEYRRPVMVEQNIIHILRGRHPLQEQVVDTFVPNDAHVVGGTGIGGKSGKNSHSVVLCTGANACGKSVYLKQIALIQYMAQIGCFVPAESATLGITDKIFTRISTRESVSRVQSAFMIDLNQVSLALRNTTSRSLIILDEFGKGTLSQDGAGLLCGVLKHLLDRGAECPKVLAATHFHDVFKKDLIDPEMAPINFCHMQVMLTSDSTIPENIGDSDTNTTANTDGGSCKVLRGERITYLYRLQMCGNIRNTLTYRSEGPVRQASALPVLSLIQSGWTLRRPKRCVEDFWPGT